MQKINVIVLSLLFPARVFAQEFRPLLNPTVACSYGSPNNPIDWEAGVQGKKKVDVLLKTIIYVDKGKIKINLDY